MKKTLILLFSIVLLSECSSETKTDENKTSKESIQETTVEPEAQTLTQYQTIQEMFANSYDFYEEDGSLKFISDDETDLHVQVSSPIYLADLETVKEEIVKRDIIYVAFQTFATTNIDKLTITATPSDGENKGKYFEKYKKSITISRADASIILNKYLNSEDFSIIYSFDHGLWLPNDNFNKLQFEHLTEVFNDLAKG